MKRDNSQRKQRFAPSYKAPKRLSHSVILTREGQMVVRIDARKKKISPWITRSPFLSSHYVDHYVSPPVGTRFLAPSIDGGDKEFVKVLSGEVDRSEPFYM